ncbi:MAG: hypothetical protein GY818_23235, partial [Planctomycetaceae bacterium]|nr:hypothetical protein [Planctomycetaceae bacterium]
LFRQLGGVAPEDYAEGREELPTLIAANGGEMTCHGLSNPVTFRIGADWITLYFMVMDTLGGMT